MKIIICIFLLAMLSSCASDKITYYYTLRPVETKLADVTPKVNGNTSIGIGPITLPEWLDQTSVISYEKDNLLSIPYYQVWAGDLEPMILNVIAANISSITGRQQVLPFPWDNRHRPHYQVRIHVEEFAGSLGENATLQLKWTLLSDQGKIEELSRAELMRVALDDQQYDTYVSALNTLLSNFSEKLAIELNNFVSNE